MSEDRGAHERRLVPMHLLATLVTIAAGAFLAIFVVWLLKQAGVSPQVQRIVGFACIALPLLALVLWWRIGPSDALSAAATLVAVAAVTVAALTYIGSVDKDAAFGCINTNGPIDATVSGETTVVYTGATAASEPRGLLLRGCTVHGVSWCVGAVHEDAIEPRVFDARWLELSGDQGFIPLGRTVSAKLPDEERNDDCEGGTQPPEDITFTTAVVDTQSGLLGLTARADGAAFIGFAVRRSEGRWQRLGWDYQVDDAPVVLPPANPPAGPGSEIAAVACVGYQQPAIAQGAAVSQTKTLERGAGLERDPNRGPTRQPVAQTAEDAACTSSVPTPPVPYEQGTVPAAG